MLITSKTEFSSNDMTCNLIENNLFLNFSNKGRFYAFKNQLIKDFNDHNFEEKISNCTEEKLEVLLEVLRLSLNQKFHESHVVFSQLLYQLDMPEKMTRDFFSSIQKDWIYFADQVAKRVFLKVILKEKYKS